MARKLTHYLSLEEIGAQIQEMEDEFTYKQLSKEHERVKDGLDCYISSLMSLKLAIQKRDRNGVIKYSADMARHADTLSVRCLRMQELAKYISKPREADNGD